ncbi:MAG: hypothetical protein IJ394_02645 [Bacteroidales bacterium]|nr:hypothetical protein [Bacteroidales bacterium]
MLLTSCAVKNSDFATVAFNDVVYVENFPQKYVLEESESTVMDLPVLGVYDIRILDSLMLLTDSGGGNGFVTVMNHSGEQSLGTFLRQGNGPNELLFPVPVQNLSEIYNGVVRFCIIDKAYKWDLSKSLLTGQSVMEQIRDSLQRNMMNGLYINDSTRLQISLSPRQDQQNRSLVINGCRHELEHLEPLNSPVLKTKGDAYLFNILTFRTRYESRRRLVVEAGTMLNSINVYSIDSSFTRTICLGNSLDNIYDIETLKLINLPYTFSDLRVYDDYFAAMYCGKELKDIRQKNGTKPLIMLFDYSCEPLALIELSHDATAFDMSGRYLYVIDGDEEILRRYDVSHILR